MTSPAATPTFAVLGAVNHGKSSVAATLAENDQVRISSMPGETAECQRFALGELFVFFDTPGFQNAREALAELRPAAQAAEPLAVFAAFIERHRGEPEFDAECRLFQPVVDGAGLIYVVDGSRPVLDIHLAEMELLRLTGAPRLAVINPIGPDDHVAEWRRRLGQHFNAVREFNAVQAGFAQRVELLETLAGIEQAWKPRLMQAVQLLRDEWQRRLDDSAGLIAGLLIDLLQHRETAPAPADRHEEKTAADALKQRYMQALAAREARAHADLIALFSHRLVKAGPLPLQLFADGLFSAPTWSLLGLSGRQLLVAGTMAGAAVGAGADAVTAGHTLLAGSVIGAAVGAAGTLMLGKRRPEIAVRLPGWAGRIRLGGGGLVVGPYAARNFPWIVLDRAVGTLLAVVQRAHARRDRVTLQAGHLRELLEGSGLASSGWDDADRAACEKLFTRARQGRLDTADRADLQALIRRHVVGVAGVAKG